MTLEQTRGELSNNPGNLNYLPHTPWRGQIGIEIVRPGMSYKPRFGRYDDAENGIRAIAKQLISYRADGLRTIRDLINRWAPPADKNDTSAYVKAVSAAVGVLPAVPIDLTEFTTLTAIVTAIIRQENGRCLYAPTLIETACRDAIGIPLNKDATA
jgi:hypothetical protein